MTKKGKQDANASFTPALQTKKPINDVGDEIIFLIRQHRNLWHQLKDLTDRQTKLAQSASPEEILKIVAGRGKLIQKLQMLEE